MDSEQCEVLLATHGMPPLDVVIHRLKKSPRHPLPVDSGRRMALARWILGACGTEALMYVSEFGVWPSSENAYAFEAIRYRKHGSDLPVWDHPGERLSSEEEYAASLLHVAVNNFWDVLVVDLSNRLTFMSSHDEWMALLTADKLIAAEFNEVVCE